MAGSALGRSAPLEQTDDERMTDPAAPLERLMAGSASGRSAPPLPSGYRTMQAMWIPPLPWSFLWRAWPLAILSPWGLSLSVPPLGPVSQSAPLGPVSQCAPLGPYSQCAPIGALSVPPLHARGLSLNLPPLGLSPSLPPWGLSLSLPPWGLSLSLPRSDLFLSLPRWGLSLRPWSSRQSMCSTHWSSVVSSPVV